MRLPLLAGRSQKSSVKRLLILGLLIAGGYFGWQHYFATSEQEHPIVRLSLFVDEHVDQILGPLPLEVEGSIAAPSQTHHLRILRENIRDMQTVAPTAETLRHATAVQLCDELLTASEERDKHIARINDTRAKNNISPLATDPLRHQAERLAFFENGIVLAWSDISRKLKARVDRRYRQLRELERSR